MSFDFTSEERYLINLYQFDSVKNTVDMMEEALSYINEPEIRLSVKSAIKKVSMMSEAEFKNMVLI